MTESSSVESVDQANQGAVPHPDMRWYVVHAYSGMEKAVERNITERVNLSLIHI